MNNVKRSASPRFICAIGRAIRCTIGVGALAWGITGHAQTTGVPPAWIAYAQLVGEQFQHSLEAYDDTANELHAFLEDRLQHPQGDAVPSMIEVRAWVGADGAVTRVAFDSLGDAQANDDLRALLMAHAIGSAPPADMRQPLRVRLELEPKPDAQPDGDPNAKPQAAPRSAASTS
ncbi:YbaB/EbfC family DNA-binding protein [Paraburkholderia humisilvae]|uniref:TonB C-terminal domain-containing protein n=1 Tax=Paraburkholderia humisilvae TaxID=627669 RepID=A0A6J5DMW8_9BURK|nr:YbaB/EbfC family DNA-binding protein [Paraburkholderia humisilvae]CAB3755253.1 hypothetical protein LMG29542_02542 [Paraburkholderia humisilvae]